MSQDKRKWSGKDISGELYIFQSKWDFISVFWFVTDIHVKVPANGHVTSFFGIAILLIDPGERDRLPQRLPDVRDGRLGRTRQCVGRTAEEASVPIPQVRTSSVVYFSVNTVRLVLFIF